MSFWHVVIFRGTHLRLFFDIISVYHILFRKCCQRRIEISLLWLWISCTYGTTNIGIVYYVNRYWRKTVKNKRRGIVSSGISIDLSHGTGYFWSTNIQYRHRVERSELKKWRCPLFRIEELQDLFHSVTVTFCKQRIIEELSTWAKNASVFTMIWSKIEIMI